MNSQYEFINWLINKFNYKTYLELGKEYEDGFNNIEIESKKIPITSKEFFSNNNDTFDIIFINGQRTPDNIYNDINSSLKVLNKCGTIVINNLWESYKGILRLIEEHDNLWIHMLQNLDGGTVIIRKTISNQILKKTIPDLSIETWHKIVDKMTVDEYIKRSGEVVICAIAKQEQPYIENWCRWHLDLGFDRIYIYDNNDLESPERYDWLEEKFPDRVEVRPCIGMRGQQILQYQCFADDNMYDWVAYIDIDEFINIKPGSYSNIKEFIYTFPNTDSYILQWQCFHANPDTTPIDKPIWEYCTTPLPDSIRKDSRPENMNGWYKSISKSGKPLEMNEHAVWGDNLVHRDCLGNQTHRVYFKWRDHSNDTVWINHYIIKNIKDFYYNKYLRGHAGLSLDATDGYTYWNWNQNLNYYTDIQGILSESEQIFLRSKGFKPNWIFRPMVDLFVHVEPGKMPWYAQRKSDLINLILSNADTCITNISSTGNEYLEYDKYGSHDFMSMNIYHDIMDSAWMMWSNEMESYGQPRIVFNMGYDPDHLNSNYDDMTRLNILNNTLNSYFVNENWLISRFHEVIENPDCMIVTKTNIEHDETCAGYRGFVDEFLRKYGCENKCLRMRNNTYITSDKVYKIMYDTWIEFVKNKEVLKLTAKSIIESHRRNESTLYDAWQFIYPSLVPNLVIL